MDKIKSLSTIVQGAREFSQKRFDNAVLNNDDLEKNYQAGRLSVLKDVALHLAEMQNLTAEGVKSPPCKYCGLSADHSAGCPAMQ
jgi:hypothetical protein